MSKQIAFTDIDGPQGVWRVSTIQTIAGGAAANPRGMAPFSDADYVDETPWPYETMVFRGQDSTGVYHEPHATEQEAREGHAYVVSHIKAGTLPLGSGVRGPFGVPSMTPKEWRDRVEKVTA